MPDTGFFLFFTAILSIAMTGYAWVHIWKFAKWLEDGEKRKALTDSPASPTIE